MIDDVSGARVTVMGLGRFGGGLGVTRWLAARGADVLVTDTAPRERLEEAVSALEPLVSGGAVTFRLGGHNVSDFTTCDLVVANPAVPEPWDDRFLRAARAAGRPITTEIRLLVERLDRRRVIGVTGSAGKSTTAAMIHHLLVRSGRDARLGGNIGGSLLGALEAITPETWIVLELSSAQLHWLGAGAGSDDDEGFSPHVAVLTNIEANHLDWHGTLEHYVASKHNIFAAQRDGDHRITADDLDPAAGDVTLAIPGAHNQRNALMAMIAVERATGLPAADAAPLLADFPGLPHRLQRVAEVGGRACYNDSKATTPGATVLAIDAFERPSLVHLIVGGYDKQIDLAPIADMAPRLGGLYTIGRTGPAIAEQAAGAGTVVECGDLATAVDAAFDRMAERDVLLLSPGCASWDQYDSYEQRGEAFCRLVERFSRSRG
jgi:UDP-N-acetylmuramoylalanine--D-glutamate ligase